MERFDFDEWNALTRRLNRLGVLHVLPVDDAHECPIDAERLFGDLCRAGDARLRQASVLLLLTRPELAESARTAITQLTGDDEDLAKRRYMAAASMQRMARTRIRERFGDQPLIPDSYDEQLGLPDIDDAYGKSSLWELAHDETARYGYDAWTLYRMLLDLFLSESRRTEWGIICAREPIETA